MSELNARRYRLLWPGRRYMSPAEILTWARDTHFNHAPKYRCRACGQDTMTDFNHAPQYEAVYDTPEDQEPPATVEDAIDYLQDQGVATFCHSEKRHP